MSGFTCFSQNDKAKTQLELIKAALALADYRVKRSKGHGYAWHVWHKSHRKSKGTLLVYNGWGKGLGGWWYFSGTVLPHISLIVQTCVGGEP